MKLSVNERLLAGLRDAERRRFQCEDRVEGAEKRNSGDLEAWRTRFMIAASEERALRLAIDEAECIRQDVADAITQAVHACK